MSCASIMVVLLHLANEYKIELLETKDGDIMLRAVYLWIKMIFINKYLKIREKLLADLPLPKASCMLVRVLWNLSLSSTSSQVIDLQLQLMSQLISQLPTSKASSKILDLIFLSSSFSILIPLRMQNIATRI